MITVVDNYDSFTYNLVQQIERLAGERPEVVRNDRFEPEELLASRPRAIVISPGPGTPARAGRCIDLIRANTDIPLLGVCLGHQSIAEAFGAAVVRGSEPVHGKISDVRHGGERLFEGCPDPMRAARYHSLVVRRETLPPFLAVDAETDDGAVMAISHRERPMFGIQFHPESFGTTGGDQLIVNFLEACRVEAERGRFAPHPAFGHPLPASRGEGPRDEVSHPAKGRGGPRADQSRESPLPALRGEGGRRPGEGSLNPEEGGSR